jgi:hypothetical protein
LDLRLLLSTHGSPNAAARGGAELLLVPSTRSSAVENDAVPLAGNAPWRKHVVD